MEKQRHELDLRKDVYLPAIESVNTLINYLLTLPTIDQSKDSSSQDLNQFANNFSKIELVGSDETIESIGHVNEELSKHVYPILIKKAQLDLLRSKVKGLEFENRKWKKKYSGFHKQILELYENRSDTSIEITRLSENAESVEKILRDLYKELVIVEEKSFNKYKEVSMLCIKAAMKLSSLTAKLISSMRKELNFPYDTEKYENIVNKQIEQAKQSYLDMFAELEKMRNET